ncbi:MAG: glycerol-3-phosphate acyltransferase [Alphaproteobacteria bacterium]|nr:glycerol-3-phosphate acyltransferase [Alphaproteobacteria bacterium]
MSKVGIIGAGAWGTALACAMKRAGNEVIIYAHEKETADAINSKHINITFLPEVTLDSTIRATNSLEKATKADAVLLVSPSQYFRKSCEMLAGIWRQGVPAIICTKGIETQTSSLMSEIFRETMPLVRVAILSGPTFAMEVADDLPTAMTLATDDETLGKLLMEVMTTKHFRIYRSRDVIGAQIGGAVKNVIAIACGIVKGRGFGENSRAAIVTRGLAEMVRLGVAKGARPETLSGLAGTGDLILTCSSTQSRNFSLGCELGSGDTLENIMKKRVSVAEGVSSAPSVVSLAQKIGVEVPICSAVNDIISNRVGIEVAISNLLARPLKEETI